MGQALSSTPPRSQHLEFVGPAFAGANAVGINGEATAGDDYVIIFSAVGASTMIVDESVVPSRTMDSSDLEVPPVATFSSPMVHFDEPPESSPTPGGPADEDADEPYSDVDVDESMDYILLRAESYEATHFREKRTAKPLAHARTFTEQAKPKPAKYGRKKKKRAG